MKQRETTMKQRETTMNTMKKLFTLLLIGVMILINVTSFTACNNIMGDISSETVPSEKGDFEPYELVYSSNGDGTCTISDIKISDKCKNKFVLEIPATSPDGEKVIAVEPTDFYSNLPQQLAKEDFDAMITRLLRACDADKSLTAEIMYDDTKWSEVPLDVARVYAYYMYIDLNSVESEEIKQALKERYPICEQQSVWIIDSMATDHIRTQRTLSEILLGRIQYTSFDCAKAHEAVGYTQEKGVLGGEYVSEIRLGSDDIKVDLSLYTTCLGLEKLTIPKGISVIPENAFNSCTNLKEIVISEGTVTIGAGAFMNCTNLTTITIPYSVTGIESGAIKNCDNLKDIYYQGTEQEWKAIEKADSWRGVYTIHFLDKVDREPVTNVPDGAPETEGENQDTNQPASQGLKFEISKDGQYYIVAGFGNCTDKDIVIPATHNGKPVKEIGKQAFYSFLDYDVDSITVPDGVTTIGDRAFQALSLKKVVLPDSITDIGEYAFSSCTNLESINIPSQITEIKAGTFAKCNSLTGISIPESVMSIGESAFSDCRNLTSVNIPSRITEIKDSTFASCKKLTNIVIPNGVISIGEYAFSDCESASSITIPDSVTSIAAYAFRRCNNVKTIVVPDSVTSMGSFVFEYAELLTDIYCRAKSQPEEWDEYWIDNCDATVQWNYKG